MDRRQEAVGPRPPQHTWVLYHSLYIHIPPHITSSCCCCCRHQFEYYEGDGRVAEYADMFVQYVQITAMFCIVHSLRMRMMRVMMRLLRSLTQMMKTRSQKRRQECCRELMWMWMMAGTEVRGRSEDTPCLQPSHCKATCRTSTYTHHSTQ